MTITSLTEAAGQCEDRAELTRWFGQPFSIGEDLMEVGDVECAAIEIVLTSIERGDDLAICNPVPADELLLSVCLGYIRSQDTRFPKHGIIGQGKSLCLLPSLSKGYIGDFDEVRRKGIGQTPRLIDRVSIDAMSQIDGQADLYSAKHGIKLDAVPSSMGALVVDLRKREWREPSQRLGALTKYLDSVSVPVIYYFDEEKPQFESLLEGVERLTITNTLLGTAQPEVSDHATTLSKHASVLASGERTVTVTAVHHPAMQTVVQDLGSMKRDLQNVPGLQTEVGWLFNLLTELPVKPQYWETAVQENYHHQSAADLIQTLRAKSSHLDGMMSDLLINYAQAASHLQNVLNRSHPLQEALFDRLEVVETDETPTRFVVRNPYERDAIIGALAAENQPLPTHAELVAIGDLEPSRDVPIVFTRPMRNARYVYEFPPSRTVEFLQFSIWADHVASHLTEKLDGTGVTINRRDYNEPAQQEHGRPAHAASGSQAAASPAQTPGSEATTAHSDASTDPVDVGQADVSDGGEYAYEVPEYDDPEALLDEVLAAEFAGDDSRSSGESSRGAGERGGISYQGPKKRIRFTDGSSTVQAPSTRVTIISGDKIVRIPAAELEPGDEMLVIDDVQTDVYDRFIQSTHEREQVRGCESTIERWRAILQEGLDTEYTPAKFIAALEEHGSTISDESTISSWRSGRTLGPQSADDVARVLEILAPDQTALATPTVEALKKIRGLHRKIGREARRSIEAQQVDGSLADGSDMVDGSVDKATMQKVVAEVSNVE